MNKRLKKVKTQWARSQRKQLFIGIFGTLLIILAVLSFVIYFQKKHTQQIDHKLPLTVTNLEYCHKEKLDLFVPQSSRPVPLVVYIHGGGWRYGSKVGGTLDMFTPLLEDGIAVASINYRLADSKKFPAAAQDILCAVRYLKSQANVYNINPDQIGLAGISAGAHLAALSANGASEKTFAAKEYEAFSSDVQAVVLINGIYDLDYKKITKTTEENIAHFFPYDSPSTRAFASPIRTVSGTSPAQLVIYSANDTLVHSDQSLQYVQKAKRVGADVQAVEVNNADHNLKILWGTVPSPSRNETKRIIRTFFNDKLR